MFPPNQIGFVCVCVYTAMTSGNVLFSRRAVGILEVTAQRRHKFAVICNLDADCTYLREADDDVFQAVTLIFQAVLGQSGGQSTRRCCTYTHSIWRPWAQEVNGYDIVLSPFHNSSQCE